MALFDDEEIGSSAAAFVHSELFARTFREGMKLVEESANYLDGQGRDASQTLERESALAYAGSSMRLTTELMQIASWLLVLRAVREGEMDLIEAADKKYRIQTNPDVQRSLHDDNLPGELINLIENAHQLFDRIARLDRDLFTKNGVVRDSDAMGQQRALMNAFAVSS